MRHRQRVVIAALAVCLLLGGLYYATATRYYQAKASLLVLQTGPDTMTTAMTPEGMRQGLMPTFEKLFSSAVVLEGALQYLQPADRVDLRNVPEENWTNVIRANLSTSTVRQTNLIEVAYSSKDPRAAVAVVNAVLYSYLEFMDKTHKKTASDIVEVLSHEKLQVEQQLQQLEWDVLEARRKMQDLGIRNGDQAALPPAVERAVRLNEELIKVQEERLELQASLMAIQQAVEKGEDLQQHILSLENVVGREFLLEGLGFSGRDVGVQTEMEKSILEDRAELKTLQAYYGPAHPKVVAVTERIAQTENYLATYQGKIDKRLSQLQNNQLGPMLLRMVQQRLNSSWQRENLLRTAFDEARAEGVNLNVDLSRIENMERDVKSLREWRDVLKNQIATINMKEDHGDIRTTVVSEPRVPTRPASPKLSLVMLMAVAAGLTIGLGLVYTLDTLDDRFRSPEDLRDQLGVPVLAMVRRLTNLEPFGLGSLQVHSAPHRPRARHSTLRTTLAFSPHDTARLAISSAEPGDGKTTVLANLAVSFAQAGKKTLLIDADLRRPGLTNLLLMKGISGLSDLLVSDAPLIELAAGTIRNSGIDGLDVLPAGLRRSNPAELLAGPRLGELLAWAETIYDQILIDSSPLLAASDATIVGRLVDGLILVVQPLKNPRRNVVRAAEGFSSLKIKLLGVVLNRIGAEKGDIYGYGSGYGYGYGYEPTDGSEGNETDESAPVSVAMTNRDSLSAADPSAAVPSLIVPRRAA